MESATINPADSSALEWGLIGGGIVLLGGAGLLAMTRRRRLREDHEVSIAPATLHQDRPVSAPVIAEPVFVQPAPIAKVTTRAPAMARPVMANGHHDLEAIVAAPPSAENPFLTRKNRLRRAHFLARQHSASVATSTPATVAQPAMQQAQRQSPVYDFGANKSQRRTWRPATT